MNTKSSTEAVLVVCVKNCKEAVLVLCVNEILAQMLRDSCFLTAPGYVMLRSDVYQHDNQILFIHMKHGRCYNIE